MAQKLNSHDVEYIEKNLAIVAKALNNWRNDSDCDELESQLSDIQSSFMEEEIDAETFLDKFEVFLGNEPSENNSNFKGIMYADYLKAHQCATLGYEFDGEPAHPELFDLNVDKFNDKNEGQFKYISPKIRDRQFKYSYSNKRRKEENGDYYIKASISLSYDNDPFYIHIVTKGGKLIKFHNYGIPLSALMLLCDENSEYEMAFVKDYRQSGLGVGTPEELSSQDLSKFKSYTRAFIEALEGKGNYTEDLNYNMANKPPKDWIGIIFSIIIVLFVLGLIIALIYLLRNE